MTIEFNCPICDKALKTSDDKAGRQAKCPGCGELLNVPAPAHTGSNDIVDAEETGDESREQEQQVAKVDTKICPMCGETIRAKAIRCRFCGEELDDDDDDYDERPRRRRKERLGARREMRPFPPGEVISDSWRIFVDNLGLSIGAFLVMVVLTFLCVALPFGPFVLAGAMADQNNDTVAIAALFAGCTLAVVAFVFLIYLQAGYTLLNLKLAREQSAEIGDLFSGGKFVGRLFVASLIFGLAVSVGILACIVPGVFLVIMFFPFAYVLVDKDPPGIDCLWRAKLLTDGNWGSMFLVLLVSWGAHFAGSLCYIGVLFTTPFINLMFAVAYDRMTCQTPLDQIPAEE